LSRQIGDAKRNNQPTEQLINSMQELGHIANNLNTQSTELSEKILTYFEYDDNSENTAKKPSLPPARMHIEMTVADNQISIIQLDDEFEAWNDYVASNPAASLYHRAEWKELIRNLFGHECFYFYASQDEEIVGVLPLIRLKSYLFGDFMVSMPYFNYGGAIANNLLIEQELMNTANALAKTIGTGHIEYRDDIVRDSLVARTDKVNMILSLPESDDSLWDSFSSKLRSQIRRAQREKVQVKSGGAECLADFYTVFAQNMRDLGTPVYGKALFENILLTFPKDCRIISIHHAGRPVAAAFLLGNKETLEIPWASTIKEVNNLSINMLLYWEVLKFAVKKRYLYFDFGRSSKDSGTFRFKLQWGAKPKQLYWHYWLPDDVDMPQLNPDNPKYLLAISIWKKLPVFLTKLLGPYIVRNLP
jgi:FemAB-related protein (PEP-CTERM system-associated)